MYPWTKRRRFDTVLSRTRHGDRSTIAVGRRPGTPDALEIASAQGKHGKTS